MAASSLEEETNAFDALIENFDILIDDYSLTQFLPSGHSLLSFDSACSSENLFELESLNEDIMSVSTESKISQEDWSDIINTASNPSTPTVLPTSSKKRKVSPSSEILKDSKENISTTIIHPPLTIVDPVQQLLHVPWHIFGAFNSGNFQSLGHLTDQLFHSNCVCRWERPVFSLEKVGSISMKQFFEACLNTVPDGVITIRQINHHYSAKNGLDVLKCKLTYTGTVLFSHFIEEFQGFKSPTNTSIEYMDATKLSPAQIEELRLTETQLRQQGQKIQVFGKMRVKFFVDPATKKIVGYEEVFRLESFAGVEMKGPLTLPSSIPT